MIAMLRARLDCFHFGNHIGIEDFLSITNNPIIWEIIEKIKMKKIIVATLLALIFNTAFSQQQSCNNSCTIGPTQSYTHVVCSGLFNGAYTPSGGGAPVSITNLKVDYVFVVVTYNIITCPNGRSTIQIVGTCFIDHRSFLSGGIWVSGPLGEYCPGTLSPPTSTCTTPTILQAQLDAINGLVVSFGLSADVDVYFKGSCNSMVQIEWPQGSYNNYTVTTETTSGSTTGTLRVELSNTTSYVSVPCDEACCMVTFKYKIRQTSQGYTESYYVPTYSPVPNDCASNPIPNYASYPDKPSAYIDDPILGTTQVFGTVVGQTPCEPICNRYMAPPSPSTFTTSNNELNNKQIPLEFSANPTVINDYLKFTTNKTIAKIMVFNTAGKKVMNINSPENNEINTSELKQGAYFVQVYFTDNNVKTVKVVKP
jgi:hypothetical protein